LRVVIFAVQGQDFAFPLLYDVFHQHGFACAPCAENQSGFLGLQAPYYFAFQQARNVIHNVKYIKIVSKVTKFM
jgi:hypothetical protein